MDFIDVMEKGREVLKALEGLQSPGEVAKVITNT